MRLTENNEFIGYLSKIKFKDGYVKLLFTFTREIELPSNAFSYEQFKAALGKCVGVLSLNGQFFLREIKELGDSD